MKKIYFWILVIIIFLIGCSNQEYRQKRNGNILSPNNTEYVFLADEGQYIIFGERDFISHIMWQPRKLRHLDGNTNAGLYSVYNDPNYIILYRIKWNSEWSEIYIKKEFSELGYSYENCNFFGFFDTGDPFAGYYRVSIEYLNPQIGISKNEDIYNFLEYLKNNEIKEFEYTGLLRNPFTRNFEINGFVGYIYGFFDKIPNLAFPGIIWENDDGQYFLVIDRKMFSINIDWLRKLGYNE